MTNTPSATSFEDSTAFGPERETYDLDFFEPMLRRVFAAPRASLYKSVVDDNAHIES